MKVGYVLSSADQELKNFPYRTLHVGGQIENREVRHEKLDIRYFHIVRVELNIDRNQVRIEIAPKQRSISVRLVVQLIWLD